MTRYESRAELAGKIDWEGGLEDALYYGIRDEDMPAGDAEMFEAWRVMQDAWKAYEHAANRVRELLPEPEYA